MFYTDPGSIFLVVVAYGISLRKYDVYASLLGIAAVIFRQNNIVWVALVTWS